MWDGGGDGQRCGVGVGWIEVWDGVDRGVGWGG